MVIVQNSSPQGIGFANGEELGEERRGTFVPRLDSFLLLLEPLLLLPREGEGKQAEPDALRCEILDDNSVSQLEEVLEMRVCVLARQTMELVRLHHRDEADTELKVPIPNVNSEPDGHVGNSGGGVIVEGPGHDWSSGWCGVTSSTIGGVVEEEAAQDRFFLRSASGFSM